MRERQLQRARDVIASPAHRGRRIIDIALQHGFATESGFIRAFRRRFGMRPSELRAEPRPVHGAANAGARRTMIWLRALTSASLPTSSP